MMRDWTLLKSWMRSATPDCHSQSSQSSGRRRQHLLLAVVPSKLAQVRALQKLLVMLQWAPQLLSRAQQHSCSQNPRQLAHRAADGCGSSLACQVSPLGPSAHLVCQEAAATLVPRANAHLPSTSKRPPAARPWKLKVSTAPARRAMLARLAQTGTAALRAPAASPSADFPHGNNPTFLAACHC